MHPTCKVLAPIAVVVLLHSLLGAAPKDKAKDVRLTFEAKPVKERFAYREPIQFRFRLENVGATDVLVLKPLTLFLSVHLKITGPDGKPVLRCGPIPLVAREEEDFRVLRPGERLEEEARISCQGEEGPPEERWGYSIPGPGKYTVEPKYRAVIGDSWICTKDGKRIPFYRGGVAASPVEFLIETPPESQPPHPENLP